MTFNLYQRLFSRSAKPKPIRVKQAKRDDFLDALVLEDRVLYSATPMPDAPVDVQVMAIDAALAMAVDDAMLLTTPLDADVVQVEQPADADEPTDANDPETENLLASPGEASQPGADDESESQTRHELLVIDERIENIEQLVASLLAEDDAPREFDIVYLDSSLDGFAQIDQALAGDTVYDAIHFVTHGDDGMLRLGNAWLDVRTVEARIDQIEAWTQSLNTDADVLFYACDFATNAEGQGLIAWLHAATGLDIAASIDETGSTLRGGDWDLELQIGAIETNSLAVSESPGHWDGLLATYTVTNTNDSGAGSLRQAILDANANAGLDTIAFNIGGGGLQTIMVGAGGLPSINEALILDGTTQPGYSGTPLIQLDGTNASGATAGIWILTDNCVARGFIIHSFPDDGIEIDVNTNPTAANNVIQNCWIGIDSTGADRGNADIGILITDGAANTQVGGTGTYNRNIISGNGTAGLEIRLGATNTTVIGNWIGVGIDGVTARGNSGAGVNILSGSTNNRIGGTTAAEANIIAYNGGDGIFIQTGGTTGNSILGNSIFSNTGLGIDINGGTEDGFGVTANDSGDSDGGANNQQNFAVLSSATLVSTTQAQVAGTLNSTASSYYRIEFFATAATPDASGYGEGQTYLGFVNVATDGSGNASFSTTLTASLSLGSRVSSTVTKTNAAYSTFTDSSEFSQNATVTNSAPALDASKSPALSAINEDAGAPSGAVGTLISQLVDFASPAGQVDNVTDSDSGALLGIAVTAANTANGTWFYSINGGTNWFALGSVSDASARLLSADANTRVYFQPNSNYSGTQADAITFRAWDRTSGTNGNTADTTTNGGQTAFSTNTDTASLTINAVNDPPVITSNGGGATANISIAENGTAVTTVTSTDVDGPSATYSIAGGADAALFSINSSTGVLTFVSGPNYESPTDSGGNNVYDVTVQVSDGTLSDTQAISVTITDVDEFDVGAISDANAAANAVNENAANGTAVGITASASDADGTTNAISYSLDNNAGGRFTIHSTTGVVTVADGTLLNREAAASHNITVRATSADGSFNTQAFTINLNDVDEFDVGAISDTNGAANAVNENAANGTAVGITASASDADATTNTITYTLDNNAGGRFAIDGSTGVVTVADGTLLNREAAASHNITVRATSADGSFSTQAYTINLNDVDEFDVGAISDTNGAANAVNENAANGTAVGITASASDADATTNTVTYTLDNNAGGRFAIDGSTGVVTVADGTLLNREAAASHNITVRATSADGSFSTQAYTINLNDVDEFDVGAISDANGAANAVNENAANGTAVGITASASDADATTNTITYTLDDNAGGRFAIDSSTGVITVADGTLLNREAAASHGITVRATSADGSFSTQAITISLNDVDEFDVGTISDTNAAANAVNENAANGTAVGITALASDADATTNTITYTLDDNAGGRFAIDGSTGIVTVADGTLLNREAAASHGITVRATSADGSFSTQAFTISLNDVDEFDVGAISDANAAANAVNENAANGTAVGITAAASDADATTNTITYTLDNNAGGRFAINGSTGIITVADGALLNREAAASHDITVRATSADGSFTTQVFTINLNDVDEFDVGTVSDTNGAANTVNENAANGTTVGITALASDADATSNSITYTLDDTAGGRFAINSSTGVVTVADGTLLNREAAASHNITVRATSADSSFSTQVFTINLNDLDEFDVGAVTDANGTANAVNENAANGSVVGVTALASDADATTNTITYTLDDTAGGRFAIESSTGVVTVADGTLLNREDAASHNITVRATSSDGSYSTQVFTISLNDVDEFDVGTVSDADAAANAVNENAANGTVVGITALASDADATTNTITYSLDDNAGGRFAINSSTGVVTVADGSLLDREAAAAHNITVRATSADSSFSTQVFTINLNDLDEFDVGAISDANAASNAVNENAANGTLVGITALAIDADATTNTVTYTLDDTAGGRFAINSSTGVVTVADGTLLNREAAASHNITVRATSADGSFSTQVFTINLNDLDEFDVGAISDTNAAANAVNENAANGTAVGITALASDADATTNTITYTLDDTAGGRFAIDGSTGVVTVADGTLLNYEAATSHNITVRATSADGSFSTQVLTIAVNAVNDNTPTITSNGGAATASVNVAENSTAVTTVTATDADLPAQTLTYSISGGADAARFTIDGSTGFLSFLAAPNFDAPADAGADNVYEVTVQVSDGTLTDTQAIAVTVTDVNEAPRAADERLAIAFDGVNDYIGVAPSGSLTMTTTMTMEAWVNPDDSANTNRMIINKEGEYEVAIFADGSLQWAFANTTPGWSWHNTGHTVEAGTWTHIAITYDSGTVTTYVNGTAVEVFGGSGSIGDNHPALNELRIGGRSNNPAGQYFDGRIDEVRIWNVARTQTEIAGAMNGELTGAETGLAGYWKFNENTGATTADSSTNGNAGTLTNGAAWYGYRINEDATLNATVPGVLGNDYDQDGDTLTAELVGDVSNGTLTLNTDGSFSYTPDQDYFGADSFTYRVFDGTQYSNVATVTIVIDPVNDAPVINSNGGGATASLSIAENATAVTTVAASDVDLPPQTLNYTILGGADAALFSIDNTTGELRFLTAPDREVPADAGANNVYDVIVQVSDGAGGADTQAIAVTVTDVDEFDVGPVSDTDATANAVNENAANGAVVGITAFAADADATTNAITYSLDNSAGGRFAIHSSTGVVTVADGTLLDRESAAAHNITVRATSADGSFSTQAFTINLNDVDEFDVGAISDTNAAANAVIENTVNGTTVGITALASDADATTNTITYTLDDSAAGRFAIDGASGIVTVADGTLLDREAAASHNIAIRATSADGSFSTQVFTINLNDLDEHDTGPVTDSDLTANAVNENAANGTTVGLTAFSYDLDATNNSITFTLDDSAAGRFAIHATTGAVTVADGTLLNREAAASHNITVRATSSDGSFSTQAFTINLNDLDEFNVGAISDTNASANAINENAANGTAVGITALASDADATTNGITYTLDDTAAGRFAIDGSTGIVTVADGTLLDREAAASHNITIRATSADGSFSTQIFTINLNDVDEFDVAAISDTNAATNALNENATNGTAVGITALASDADATTNTITYTLDDSASGRFAIDGSTGIVTVADGTLLDREAAASHNITIRATSADGSFSTQIFTINLNDVDEFDIGPISDTNAAANAVNENAATGTLVGITALASDADATSSVNYTLDDDAGGRFAIDGTTGVLTVADGTLLDREAAAAHNITVRATSSDGSFSTQAFTINLNDVDEFDVGPISDTNVATNDVDENAANGTVVGIAALASDADATTNTISYTLDDDASGRFAIDAVTGVVTVADGTLLDHEVSASHNITVRATSADGSFSTQVFSININPVNDNDPIITSGGGGATAAYSVAENSTAVATITATDADLPAQTLTFAITGGADAALFTIDATTGDLQFAAAPNFEAPSDAGLDNVYDVIVEVIDGAGRLDTQALSVTVTGVNEAPIAQTESYTVTNILSLAVDPSGVLANDADPEGDPMSAVLLVAPQNGTLTLNPDGSLTYTPHANFTGVDTFTYQSTDGALSSAPIVVEVVVTSSGGPPPDDGDPIDDGGSGDDGGDSEDDTTDDDSPSNDGGGDRDRDDDRSRPPGGPGVRDRHVDDSSSTLHVDSLPKQRARSLESDSATYIVDQMFEATKGARRAAAHVARSAAHSVSNLPLVETQFLGVALDQMRNEIESSFPLTRLLAGSVAVASAATTAGYALWAVRSAHLVTTFLATLPAWCHFDPLPLLSGMPLAKKRDEGESLSDIVRGQQALPSSRS